MYIPTTVKEQSLWLAYLLISVFFILLFVFRETLSQWKEILKAKIRTLLYDKMIQVSVVGDTAKTSTGFLSVLFHFLDDHFLKPSDGLPYDYLLYEDSDDELEKTENEDEEEYEYEDEVEEDEKEGTTEDKTDVDNVNQVVGL